MPVAKLLVTEGNPGHSYVLVFKIKLSSTSLTRTVSAAIGIKKQPRKCVFKAFHVTNNSEKHPV